MQKKNQSVTKKNLAIILLLISSLIFSIGCEKKEEIKEVVEEETTKIPVETVAVKQGNFNKALVLSGVTKAKDEVSVIPKTMGMEKIIELHIKEGDKVSAGQTIAVLDHRSTDVQMNSAQIAYEDAQKNYERNKVLFESGALPQINLEQSETALRNAENNLNAQNLNFDNSIVTTPISGTVTQLIAKKGGMASGQTPIAVVTDLSTIEVKTNINEMQINKVKLGHKVRMYIPALGGKPLTGTIVTINPLIDEKAKAYPVTIHISNTDGKIKSGMYTEIELITDSISKGIIIPAQAIITRENESKVFVVRDNKAVAVKVELGLSNGDETIITKGLKVGEQVITYGNEDVVNGDEVVVTKRGDK
ncbi:RND family efflux transporter, MFP subunit [Desulfonispora thiosulfatigenes DSM 11270]|uniref:RND family efflux transporter, MFP subunit n=1 Tax=Desulfonispora thiosulfatigenes DSM 11270 TaxID=656914 RepID=A0A1W1V4W6_DESTI|nr:efflux RND transporter periplasmic adaptor subunit [Desulfonispora thiosulfatigenes]SMB88437.1 RND family efflux transporter, MFP subunit [Desulfonispora thiosulfatigenes DSM 11270]